MIPDINLLPKVDKKEGNSTLFYILLVILVVFIVGFFAWQYFTARNELNDLTVQQAALQGELEQLQVQHGELVANNKGSLEESVNFVKLVSYPVSPLIDEIQVQLPEYTYLRSYTFKEASVTIAVDFETLADIATYVRRLEASPYFSDAQLNSVANFVVSPVDSEEEEDELQKFNEVPRYAADIVLTIDRTYLATGGVQ